MDSFFEIFKAHNSWRDGTSTENITGYWETLVLQVRIRFTLCSHDGNLLCILYIALLFTTEVTLRYRTPTGVILVKECVLV